MVSEFWQAWLYSIPWIDQKNYAEESFVIVEISGSTEKLRHSVFFGIVCVILNSELKYWDFSVCKQRLKCWLCVFLFSRQTGAERKQRLIFHLFSAAV